MGGNGSQPTTPRPERLIMSNVTTYQDLLDNDHKALMSECDALYPPRKAKPPRARSRRSEAAMLREYEMTLAATSINMIDFSSNPME